MCDNCGTCEFCDLKRSHKTINILAADPGKPDTMPSNYKLTYFPIQGLAEPIRLLLSYGDIAFEDDRFEMDNWPNIKPAMPFGQVPVLEIDGKQTHQSLAICRYVAKQVKLTGANELEDLEIDSIVDTVNDFRSKITLWYYEKDETYQKVLKERFFADVFPYYIKRLEEVAVANNGHLALGKLTWADFYLAGIKQLVSHYLGFDLLKDSPNLAAVYDNVVSVPNVKAWVEKRPVTEW